MGNRKVSHAPRCGCGSIRRRGDTQRPLSADENRAWTHSCGRIYSWGHWLRSMAGDLSTNTLMMNVILHWAYQLMVSHHSNSAKILLGHSSYSIIIYLPKFGFILTTFSCSESFLVPKSQLIDKGASATGSRHLSI